MIVARWHRGRPYCGGCRRPDAFGDARWSVIDNGLRVSMRWRPVDGEWRHVARSNRSGIDGRPVLPHHEDEDGQPYRLVGAGPIVCRHCGQANEIERPNGIDATPIG